MDRYTTELVRKIKPNDKNLGFPSSKEQSHILPSLQGIGRHAISIFLEFQKSGCWPNSPYYWNSKNRSISKIGSTPGNTQIENSENSAYFGIQQIGKLNNILYKWNSINRQLCRNSPYIWNSRNRVIGSIFGIPFVGTSFTNWNSLDFRLVCRK